MTRDDFDRLLTACDMTRAAFARFYGVHTTTASRWGTKGFPFAAWVEPALRDRIEVSSDTTPRRDESCPKCDINFPCWNDRPRCQRGFPDYGDYFTEKPQHSQESRYYVATSTATKSKEAPAIPTFPGGESE